jgi:hypothetical protein
MDGSVFLWNLKGGQKVAEHVVSRVNLSRVVTSPDLTQTCIAGTDDKISQLDFSRGGGKGGGKGGAGGDGGKDVVQAAKDGQLVSAVAQIESNLPLGELLLSPSGDLLFAGVSAQGHPGRIRAYELPLDGNIGTAASGGGAFESSGGGDIDEGSATTNSGGGDESNGYSEFQCHAAEITHMRCSHDGSHLFTTGEDGSLCVLEIRESGGLAAGAKAKDHVKHAKENPLAFAEEILVTKSDIEEQASMMGDLKQKVDELTLHNEYQLRRKDINYKERIKEVTKKFTTELAQDRTRYDDLVEEKREMELEYEERLGELGLKHGAELTGVEATYTNKIHAEQGRYQQLVQERDEQNLRWDEENELMVGGEPQAQAGQGHGDALDRELAADARKCLIDWRDQLDAKRAQVHARGQGAKGGGTTGWPASACTCQRFRWQGWRWANTCSAWGGRGRAGLAGG